MGGDLFQAWLEAAILEQWYWVNKQESLTPLNKTILCLCDG